MMKQKLRVAEGNGTLLRAKKMAIPGEGAVGRRTRLRDDLQRRILFEAERIFAENGFAGTSIASIASASGLSKQNLMYYFPTKLLLYKRVLGDVLDDWLHCMRMFAHSSQPIESALVEYIDAKFEFSRRRPLGSRVFALEIIGGAKNYGKELRAKIVPALRDDIAALNRSIKPNGSDPLSAEHLFFIIWAATQSYADFASQMELILGRRPLSATDFDQGRATLSRLVLNTVTSFLDRPRQFLDRPPPGDGASSSRQRRHRTGSN